MDEFRQGTTIERYTFSRTVIPDEDHEFQFDYIYDHRT